MDIVFAMVLAALTIGGFFLFNKAWLPLWLVKLGETDTWWNPVRSEPPAGQYAVMRKFTFGKKTGGFAKIIHSIEKHYVDENYNFVEGDNPKGPGYFERRWGKKYGLVWVGFFKKYFIQETEYAAIDKAANSTEYKVVTKKRNTDDDPYYFFQYSTMAATVRAAEIAGSAQIDMQLLFTAVHKNPYKVHFLAGKWTVRATAAVERGAKEYVRNKEYEKFREERADMADGLVVALENLGEEYLIEEYGLDIKRPELISFDLVGGQKIKDAVLQKEINRNLADAAEEKNREVTTLAEGQRRAREILAKGIEVEYKARMVVPQGDTLSIAEALRDSKLTGTIVLGNNPVAVPLSK